MGRVTQGQLQVGDITKGPRCKCQSCGAESVTQKLFGLTMWAFDCAGCGYKWSESKEGRWVFLTWDEIAEREEAGQRQLLEH